MPTPNIFSAAFEYDDQDPDGYRSGVARVGAAAGGRDNVVKLFEVPSGQSICPYHYEYEEEWLVLLDGTLRVRTPDGESTVNRGALVCFPAGPDGAHKVSNDGEDRALVMMFSSAREPSVAIYPDSDKIGVWPGRAEDHVILR
ncbi:MAG: cupin domain-containing protein, partial [Solirubrobacteraceae bacterium]